jgi:phosphomannomutase/phosphoglucomutase
MKAVNVMDYNILRENDIRGEYGTQIDSKVAKRIGLAFGTYAKLNKASDVIVGHDNRLSGEELHAALIEGLLATGINVLDIGLATTPLFNFSSITSNICYGIMITASHNDASDNGFKIFGENFLHLEQDELKKFYNIIKNENYVKGQGYVMQSCYKNAYVKMLRSKATFKKNMKVVFDCGHGTPSILVRDVFDNLGLEVTYLHSESDGSFPVHNPDPNDVENLGWLIDEIKSQGADIGIAFDGDGDRIGIVDENGDYVENDILMAIFAGDIIPPADNKNVILDVKCSKALEIELERIGANAMMLKNGSAYIETQIFKAPALFGGEYSGHVFFRDDFEGYDDGVYAAIRIIELLCRRNLKCSESYTHIEKFYNTPELRVKVPDDQKWDIVEKVKEYALERESDVLTIDGVRVNYKDGFSLIRCSNTGPTITLRFEAKDEKTLDLRKREYLNLVNHLIK